MKKTYIPEPGDEIRTTAIAPDGDEKSCKGKVRTVRKTTIEVIYGIYSDRAWVPITSSRFIRKRSLSMADRDKYAACCG